jgi:hypothetical protein
MTGSKIAWFTALLMSAAGAGSAAGPASARSAPAPANQSGQPVLVELFTSQGCSSCPPADRFVRGLPAHGLGPDKVVALTFHVDVWDHLGWPDPFASPPFTDRQAWYADSGRLRGADGDRAISGIYTPQMIVGGQVHFPGGETDVALRQIAAAAARPAPVNVALTTHAAVEGGSVNVRARVPGAERLDRAGDWKLTVALVQKTAETRVLRGENGGETLQEASVVRALSPRLPLTLRADQEIAVTLHKPADVAWTNTALVLFVQSEKTREVAATAEIDLPPR